MKRSCAAFVVVLLVFVAIPATAWAGPDNVAVAINERDGSSVFRLSFTVLRISGNEITPMNVALAVGRCSDCLTVAIALQVVVVLGDAETIAPVNVAAAINENCLRCLTAAAAYQLVATSPESFKFTNETKEELRDLREAFEDLLESELPLDQLLAEADALASQVFTLVLSEIESGGRVTGNEKDTDIDGGASPSPSGSPTPTEEPTPSSSPSPDESSPNESPSPEPTPSSSP
ncbi:MAG: hypothetical protein ACRDI3_00990 [Actinomycetota bacterium]